MKNKIVILMIAAFAALGWFVYTLPPSASTPATVLVEDDVYVKSYHAQYQYPEVSQWRPEVLRVQNTTDTGDNKPGSFLQEHWGKLLVALLSFIEVIVRLTPTDKDNSIFSIVNVLLNAIVPNRRIGGGTHPE